MTDISTQAEAAAKPTSSFLRLTERLSEASVRRRWEAYRDVDWEAPEHQIDPEDPRWEAAASWDALAASEWYRDQAPERRAAIGLYRQAAALKVGMEFEQVLSAGMLRFASRLPNGHPAFRYVYHEITEEAQHSMMFQEFINRSGVDPVGLGDHVQPLFHRFAELGSELPVLFFLGVLSGEEAFDFINRQMIKEPTTHPLMAKVSRIHVIEEARHVSFARAFLRDVVPRVGAREIRELRYQAATAVHWAVAHMFDLNEASLTAMGVPGEVAQAVVDGPESQMVRSRSIANVMSLCHELGLADARLASIWTRITGPHDVAAGEG